ncbi:MAG: ribokinase [Treponema sp.]|jgi:ribokinase|nr:ribokinase [Treponema sp.]
MGTVKVVVQGSMIFDLITKAKVLPKVGQAVIGTGFGMFSGGKGANQAVQLARLGAGVTMIGRIGCDFMGDFLLERHKEEGINTKYITRDKETATSLCAIHVDEQGHNDIIVVPQANGRCSAADVEAAESSIAEADVVLTQLETTTEAMEKTVELGAKHGKPVVLNPAPAAKISSEVLKQVFLLTPNETEAEEISGIGQNEYDAEEWRKRAAAKMHDLGAERVIITLGEAGCYYSPRGSESFAPAFKIKPEDSTAAGDAFNGALCFALARGKTVEEAMRWGNAAGALAASRFGSQASLCTMAELVSFLEGQ